MKDPIERYSYGIKVLLRYILLSYDRKITYRKGKLKLVGFSDIDYVVDKADRKSTLR